MYWLFSRRNFLYLLTCVALLTAIVLVMADNFQYMSTGAKDRKLPIYSVQTDKKAISLGINCAWDDTDIPQLLKIMEQYNVKATFFVLGQWCDKYPDSVKKMAEAGHEIASHSNTHPDMTKLSRERIAEELEQTSAKIQSLTGKSPSLFRAPSGAYNNLVIDTATQLGYYTIQWIIDSIDWKNKTTEQIVERVVAKAENGGITLFHSGTKGTPAALPIIIEKLQSDGFQFVPVGELIYKEGYTIDHTGKQCLI